jgi:prevent-host-death family protein
MRQVGVLEARNQLSALIKEVQAGGEVVITSRGVPRVRMVSVDPVAPQGSVTRIRAALDADRRPPGDHASIEAAIAEERGAWD